MRVGFMMMCPSQLGLTVLPRRGVLDREQAVTHREYQYSDGALRALEPFPFFGPPAG
jgi:hypothetical protein